MARPKPTLAHVGALISVALLLCFFSSACRKNPYFSNHTVVGILNLNGFGPGNTKIGLVDPLARSIAPISGSMNDKLWEHFLKEQRVGYVEPPPPDSGVELRLEAPGAGGARMIVAPNDMVWLELGVDKPFAAPREEVDGFIVKGLFAAIQSLATVATEDSLETDPAAP
jgi:hypothetical protein